ncbi:LCP family protein [Micropruina sonneratiae]|uniref:LCP family protein n=1 Tax=Micropruina sonneratiae TaxID=2986940 RepID=UPI0022275A21|nr:LCP family protein [Micropruina sp. KQZ13P-5]MCW3159281.1 LCP family protein [Micropruina sp. KQZ13P-5]
MSADDAVRTGASAASEPVALDELMSAEPQRKPRSRRVLRRWLVVLASLVLALFVGAGGLAVSAVNVLNSVKREPSMLPSGHATLAPSDLNAKPINFLLLGSDSRGEDRGRSDVMMLVHSDPSRQKLYLISMPRDLWVDIPGHGTNKINAAYAFGGASLAVETVEDLLGVRIENVAVTDFDGFFSIIDDLGGVTVTNELASASRGYTFPKGELTLDGAAALVYVRERYDLPRGDFDRAERQRLVMKAIIDKLSSPETLANPVKLLSVINRLSANVVVDDTATTQHIVGMVGELNLTNRPDVVQLQVPVAGFGTSSAGASFVRVDEAGMNRLSQALVNGTMDSYSSEK